VSEHSGYWIATGAELDIVATLTGRKMWISNYAKRGRFVISKVTIWGYLMQKGKKKHKKLRFNAK
jgi:hypothetical protein